VVEPLAASRRRVLRPAHESVTEARAGHHPGATGLAVARYDR